MTLHSRDVQKRLLVSASDIKRNQCQPAKCHTIIILLNFVARQLKWSTV
jgi:hypothetical protein